MAEERYADAEPLYQWALTIREKALGPDHPLVAQSLNNLALLYIGQGRYAPPPSAVASEMGHHAKRTRSGPAGPGRTFPDPRVIRAS
jgi:Tetratricopeptide repeat